MPPFRLPLRNLSSISAPLLRPTSRFPTTILPLLRPYSTPVSPPDYLDAREKSIFDKLATAFSPTQLEVQDVSGGCGSMYAVEISSAKFKGLPLLKQHRLVKDALGEEVKEWHGFQLRTKVPE